MEFQYKHDYSKLSDKQIVGKILAEPHDEEAVAYMLHDRYAPLIHKLYRRLTTDDTWFNDCVDELFIHLRDDTIFEPEHPALSQTYPLDIFQNAWDDSANYIVILSNQSNDAPHPLNLKDVPIEPELLELCEAIAKTPRRYGHKRAKTKVGRMVLSGITQRNSIPTCYPITCSLKAKRNTTVSWLSIPSNLL